MREESGALFNTEAVLPVDQELVDELKRRALSSPTGRFRLCLHHSTSEPVQQMIIAHRRANYSRPHRQNASKLYVMIEGKLNVLLFDDAGELFQTVALEEPGNDAPFCVRLAPGCWHTTFAVSPCAVVCEVMGTANPDGRATEHASWAPAEDDPAAIAEFLKKVGLADAKGVEDSGGRSSC